MMGEPFMGDKCNCHCHRMPNVKHIVACCAKCPVCGVNIRIGGMARHQKSHVVEIGPTENTNE